MQSGTRDQFLAAVAPLVAATLLEDGCHTYAFTPDPDDADLIRLYELWDDEASLARTSGRRTSPRGRPPARAADRVGRPAEVHGHRRRPAELTRDGRDDPDRDGVRCMLMRGGTSKGAYFLADDLPADPAERDDLLLRIMGSPDARQIDGIGGAHPLTSKVAVGRPVGTAPTPTSTTCSCRSFVDQADRHRPAELRQPARRRRRRSPSSAAWSRPTGGDDRVGAHLHGQHRQRRRRPRSRSPTVGPCTTATPRSTACPAPRLPIRLDFDDIAGGSCGALLPTGNAVDVIDGVDVHADRQRHAGRRDARRRPRHHRRRVARRARGRRRAARAARVDPAAGRAADEPRRRHRGDACRSSRWSRRRAGGGDISTRTFIPHRCHEAIGVLGAVSVATAALLPGSPAASVAAARRTTGRSSRASTRPASFAAAIDVDASTTTARSTSRGPASSAPPAS